MLYLTCESQGVIILVEAITIIATDHKQMLLCFKTPNADSLNWFDGGLTEKSRTVNSKQNQPEQGGNK